MGGNVEVIYRISHAQSGRMEYASRVTDQLRCPMLQKAG